MMSLAMSVGLAEASPREYFRAPVQRLRFRMDKSKAQLSLFFLKQEVSIAHRTSLGKHDPNYVFHLIEDKLRGAHYGVGGADANAWRQLRGANRLLTAAWRAHHTAGGQVHSSGDEVGVDLYMPGQSPQLNVSFSDALKQFTQPIPDKHR